MSFRKDLFRTVFVYHKNWITNSVGTDKAGELCYNFSSSDNLNQMDNFPTWIPEYDSHSPALLGLFLFPDANTCSTMDFPWLGNSDVVVSVSSDSPSNSKGDAPFHCIAFDHSCADWSGLYDHVSDVSWMVSLNLVLLLLLVNFMSGFSL